jgi:acetoin utilization deacetylase AcuC-like enzyme
MKVVYHPAFTQVYTHDPAAQAGRMEAVVRVIEGRVTWVEARPAARGEIERAHTASHVDHVARREGLYEIAALAAGGAIEAARTGIHEPAFGLIRPPGHHASSNSSWGFCYFNNMAVALLAMWAEQLIRSALVLDIDLHFGDGTVNILGGRDWVRICNPSARSREGYLAEVDEALAGTRADLIGISAGFDFHELDWGGLLSTEDYRTIGARVRSSAGAWDGGCFAVLEGGYNHDVLGQNVAALLDGLAG